MDFDNEDGTLYIFLYRGSGANVYGTVNLATGVVTALASTNPTGEFEGATQTLGLCIPNDYTLAEHVPDHRHDGRQQRHPGDRHLRLH